MRHALHFFILFPLLPLAAAACGGKTNLAELAPGPASTTADGGVVPPGEHASRFAGLWIIDDQKSPHNSYAASLYSFGTDGSVTLLRTIAGGAPDASRIGLVRDPNGIWCALGYGWSSQGTSTLLVGGSCSDGQSRTIVMSFTGDPTTNAAGASTSLTSVGGETGWSDTTPFGWLWTKCVTDASRCLP